MAEMQTLVVTDKAGQNDLRVTIDWDNRRNNPVLHATMGNLTAKLDGNEFWKVAFMLANEDQQTDMIPMNTQATRHFSKLVKIRANKQIKKGEEIVAKVNFSITDEHLKKIFGKEEKTASGLVMIQAPEVK
jgi:hypothetical protein